MVRAHTPFGIRGNFIPLFALLEILENRVEIKLSLAGTIFASGFGQT
jgi:hypothetical protein